MGKGGSFTLPRSPFKQQGAGKPTPVLPFKLPSPRLPPVARSPRTFGPQAMGRLLTGMRVAPHLDEMASSKKQRAAIESIVNSTFSEYDTDGGGVLSLEEATAAMNDLVMRQGFLRSFSAEQVEEALLYIDEDGDGQVSLDEFFRFYLSFVTWAKNERAAAAEEAAELAAKQRGEAMERDKHKVRARTGAGDPQKKNPSPRVARATPLLAAHSLPCVASLLLYLSCAYAACVCILRQPIVLTYAEKRLAREVASFSYDPLKPPLKTPATSGAAAAATVDVSAADDAEDGHETSTHGEGEARRSRTSPPPLERGNSSYLPPPRRGSMSGFTDVAKQGAWAVLRQMKGEVSLFSEAEQDTVNGAFLKANSGHEDGRNRKGNRSSVNARNISKSFEQVKNDEEAGNLSTAQMPLAKFRLMCQNAFGIKTPFIQDALFRACRPGHDSRLTSRELMVGLAPAIKGNPMQRAAFMFVLYDSDNSDLVTLRELGKMHNAVAVGCAIERDLLAFALTRTGMKKKATFKDYLEHVQVRERERTCLLTRARMCMCMQLAGVWKRSPTDPHSRGLCCLVYYSRLGAGEWRVRGASGAAAEDHASPPREASKVKGGG